MRRLVVGVLIAWALILSGLFLAGCGSEAPARTWPEVAGKVVESLGAVGCVYLLTRASSHLRGTP